jgi:hypothetical protein
MTVTFAPPTRPMPPGTPRGAPSVFGREVVLAGEPGAPRALQWRLGRKAASCAPSCVPPSRASCARPCVSGLQ